MKTLKEKKLSYEYNKNIPPETFGIEIEVADAEYNEIKNALKQVLHYEPTILGWNTKSNKIENLYEVWRLKNDNTVQTSSKEDRNIKLGGEITTPIMYNNKKCWQELELICNTLKQVKNIKINGNCSIHIHTDKHIYTSIQEYVNLLKLWMIYEDIIYRFSYGEKNGPRKLTTTYAKPISYIIYEILGELEKIETESELIKLMHYERKNGLNLTSIDKEKQTIEVRTYNGTLNEKIIQNDVLFNQNLLNYAKTENFDKEFIDYKIKQYELLYLSESVKMKPEKAKELACLLFKNELDRLNFLKQYLKAYNDDDIEKTYHLCYH